ncbi:MAG: NACHT domain-containing protein, partial [Planctomycetes bacterium]|nr:NACHT domain-containing protein [Planctomycetota bacterium]
SGVFVLAGDAEAEAAYRQHVVHRFGKLTLYSVTSDAPLAVDLERVFVKLTATQRRLVASAVEPTDAEIESMKRIEAEEDGMRRLKAKALLAKERVEEAIVTLSISDALRAHPCLALIGAPGAGKTTLLKYLALTFARRQAKERLQIEEERLPVFIALRDFNRFLANLDKTGQLGAFGPTLLGRFLREHTADIAPHLKMPGDFFDRALDEGSCLVLLDGLDEVADPLQRGRTAEAVAAMAGHYQGNRFVVTSRPRGYETEARQRLAPLCAECAIRDFDESDRAAFANAWYTAVITDREGDTPTARDKAGSAAADLIRAVQADARITAMACNPLLLTILAMVHQRGVGLPQRRVDLYEECTEFLLGYWDQVRGGPAARELAEYGGLTRSEKRALLEPIALWLHERGESGLEVAAKDLEAQVARQFRELFGDPEPQSRRRAELFLRVITERAGLLVERETGVYAFSHLTFQEYLAARALADRSDYVPYTLQRLHDPWWREVVLLEAAHLSSPNTRRSRELSTALIQGICHAGSWLESVLRRDLLLACRALADISPLGVQEQARQDAFQGLFDLWKETPYGPQRQDVVDLFAYVAATPDGARIRDHLSRLLENPSDSVRGRAADALGRLGGTAATPAVLGRLVELSADPSDSVRGRAADALG